MVKRKEEQELNQAFLNSLEEIKAEREDRHWLLGVIVILIVATAIAPVLAVWVKNCFFNGGG